jgi:hypothetical protein
MQKDENSKNSDITDISEVIEVYTYRISYSKVKTIQDVVRILEVVDWKFGKHVPNLYSIDDLLEDYEDVKKIVYSRVESLQDVVRILEVVNFNFTADAVDDIYDLVESVE